MLFISSEDQDMVALSAIQSYSYTQNGKVRAIDRQGESHHFSVGSFEQAVFGAIITAIPAAPGTFFLTGVTDANGAPKTWDRDPVIAWGIKADGGVIPIGTDGADSDNRPILAPSGTVTAPFGNWTSYEEFVAQAGD